MADSDDGGAVILAILAAIAIFLVVVVGVAVLLTGGTIFGAGTALRNYARAFRMNVRPERMTS